MAARPMSSPSSERPRIVVVTPVRNEEWILDRFLSVTSRFADHIIIADQHSSDNSRCICERYPKVTVVDNPTEEFSERNRSLLLIEQARALVPSPRIILALDADEILAANALESRGWQTMLKAAPGTILCFELVDLYGTPERCMRHDQLRPFGYVDDGAPHAPRTIHSNRVPVPDNAVRLRLHDIKFLHYNALRPSAVAAKVRWYSVLEKVLDTCPFALKRRLRYATYLDFTGAGRVEACPAEWFAGWEQQGIDMRSVVQLKYYWYDFEVLRYFEKYGSRRFWLDDIWQFDWEACRLYARAQNIPGVPEARVAKPPGLLNLAMRFLSFVHRHQRRLRHRLTRRASAAFQ